jgi:hypothetical protein
MPTTDALKQTLFSGESAIGRPNKSAAPAADGVPLVASSIVTIGRTVVSVRSKISTRLAPQAIESKADYPFCEVPRAAYKSFKMCDLLIWKWRGDRNGTLIAESEFGMNAHSHINY